MKPYILGAIAVWFLMGFAGAIMLGQQRIDAPTIVSGPFALWAGLNKPGYRFSMNHAASVRRADRIPR